MHASPPCGTADTLRFDLCGCFSCLQGVRKCTRLMDYPSVIPKEEEGAVEGEADVSFNVTQRARGDSSSPVPCFLISSWSRSALRYLWMAPTTDAAWPIVHSICCDRHRQIGDASWVLSTCPALGLDDWVHTKLLVTLISEQVLVFCYISGELVWVIQFYIATHLL